MKRGPFDRYGALFKGMKCHCPKSLGRLLRMSFWWKNQVVRYVEYDRAKSLEVSGILFISFYLTTPFIPSQSDFICL